MKRFFRTTLRTLDVDAAEKFYLEVLGTKPVGVVPLHEQAIARGAKPHWLGFLDVGDVEPAVAAFVERGAISMGPKWINPEGLEAGMMRDPGGALIALAKPPPQLRANDPEVVFHVLNTPNVAHAMKAYGELFGWSFGAAFDLANVGTFYPFAWEPGAPTAGVFGGIEGREGVHPHWTFHFRIAGLDAAIDRVRALGGLALAPIELANGDRVAVCDDSQGAAFALLETPAPR